MYFLVSGIEDEPTFGQVLAVNNQLNVTRTRVTYYTTDREGHSIRHTSPVGESGRVEDYALCK